MSQHVVSRHKERLRPILDQYRMQDGVDNDGDAIECLLIDVFRRLDDLCMDYQTTIDNALRDHKAKKESAEIVG